jgi:hypothetical protein
LGLASLVVSALAGTAANDLANVARDQFALLSEARSAARIKKINDEVAEITRLRAEPSAATAYVGALVLKTVIPSALAAIFSVATALVPAGKNGHPSTDQYVAGGLAFVTLAFGAYAATRAVRSCRRIYDAAWYGRGTARQLSRLKASRDRVRQGDRTRSGGRVVVTIHRAGDSDQTLADFLEAEQIGKHDKPDQEVDPDQEPGVDTALEERASAPTPPRPSGPCQS